MSHFLRALIILLGLPNALWAADAVIAGAIRVDATYENLGVRWSIGGDDDGDSRLTLELRRAGTTLWRAAAPALGARPELVVNGSPLGLHYWAASALFLEPDTAYELRLRLEDPDGGSTTRVLTASTRRPIPDPPPGRLRYAVPGTGGGSGSLGDPFRGLQAAADGVVAGDVVLVDAGLYEPFAIATSGSAGAVIAFVGPPDGSAIVDGGGTDRGVVTLGTGGSAPVSHLLVQGLTIQNGRWGVDLQHSSDIVLRRNRIRDVDFGVLNRRAADLERRQTVCDNVILGRTPWPGSGIPAERGIDLRGHGHVVCHNLVRDFGDCISVQPFTGDSFGNDVFGNDVARCVDDGIEIDYNQSNVRVWRNRVYNARMGVSVQPIAGGPAYILRNELFNLEDKPIKLHNSPAGLWVAHNTGAKRGNAVHDTGSSNWRNAVFRNNLWLGTEYAFEFINISSDGFRDFDYNGWGTTRGGSLPHFKWNNVRYDTLGDLQGAVGIELRGVTVAFDDLVDATLPASWDVEVAPASRDLRLASALPRDRGEALPNLNEPFVFDGRPDLGAFEVGSAPPAYGPRRFIFRDGFESGDTDAWQTGP
ncbi:MAG: right-handed parallel beta-helix repeat-containing protein [Acidobacteriota bacterium]